MKKTAFLFFIILFCAAALQAQGNMRTSLLKGGKAYRKLKYGQAYDWYKKALPPIAFAALENNDLSEENFAGVSDTLLYNLGAASYKLKDYKKAKFFYNLVSERNGEYGQDSKFNEGNVYFKEGKNDKAIAAYRSAILQNMNDKEAIHNLQLLLEEKKEDEQSEDKQDKENSDQPDSQQGQENAKDTAEQKQQEMGGLMQLAAEQETPRSKNKARVGQAPKAEMPEKDW